MDEPFDDPNFDPDSYWIEGWDCKLDLNDPEHQWVN